jgi:hypothetical protein
MTELKALKQNIFRVFDYQISLKDFESWLYTNTELANLLNDEIVLETYSFNYNQKDAGDNFKNRMKSYFDLEEFILWKVKSNLSDLINGTNDSQRILRDLTYLGYDGYGFLISIGHYKNRIEDHELHAQNVEDIHNQLKENCSILLAEINRQESNKLDFKLSDFQNPADLNQQPLTITWEWWKPWG